MVLLKNLFVVICLISFLSGCGASESGTDGAKSANIETDTDDPNPTDPEPEPEPTPDPEPNNYK